jgi:hypothetical protein
MGALQSKSQDQQAILFYCYQEYKLGLRLAMDNRATCYFNKTNELGNH